MGCACNGRSAERFLWYNENNPEGEEPMVYKTEVEAKAKVMRKGGEYIVMDPNMSIEQNIMANQAAKRAAQAAKRAAQV